MKKLSIMCAFVLVFGLMASQAFGLSYCKDVLEPGNSGGWAGLVKSFDDEYTVSPGDTFDVDIWINGAPGGANLGGFWIDFTDSTDKIAYVGCGRYYSDGTEAGPGPWDPGSGGNIVNEPAGVGTLMVTIGFLAGAGAMPDGDGDIIIAKVTFECIAAGDANIKVNPIAGFDAWSPNTIWPDTPADEDAEIGENTLVIHQEVECVTADDCPYHADGLVCTGDQSCIANKCIPPTIAGPFNPCDDTNDCTLNICEEPTPPDVDPVCTYPCDVAGLTGPTDPCCTDAACENEDICAAQVTLTINPESDGYAYYSPSQEGVIIIKKYICMNNPPQQDPITGEVIFSGLVGAIQFDLCEEIGGVPIDCTECKDCELTERTTIFDCFVNELDNGCCRVILIGKHPGAAINPGICNIVVVVELMYDECRGVPLCITEYFDNIVVSDYDGYSVAAAGLPGSICPIACGDVCPAGNPPAWDCGDGVVDIFDIMCEVDFALADVPIDAPNACQLPRADVPTGTPPVCIPPDGDINILDIMVLIDMALGRQNCCDFYYLEIMYQTATPG